MRLFLVRHGESLGNVDPTYYDKCPNPQIDLTQLGVCQAVGVPSKIMHLINPKGDESGIAKNEKFHIESSSYRRAVHTAQIIRDGLDENPLWHSIVESVSQSPLIREREWGNLQSYYQDPDRLHEAFDFYHRPKGGESYADCLQRVAIYAQGLFQKHPHNENIVIVSHGEAIRCLVMYLLDQTVEEFTESELPQNCEIIGLVKDINGWVKL